MVPIVAATLGFIVNGIRIAILAHLAAPSSEAAFDYMIINFDTKLYAFTVKQM